MKILIVSGELPSSDKPGSQSFITRQIDSLRPYCSQIDVYEVTGNKLLKHFKSARHISKISSNYDIIHVHYGLFAIGAILGKGNTPLVLSLMGSDLLGTPNKYGKVTFATALEARLTKYLVTKCDRVIVKTQEMADAISSIQIDIVPNGVDLELFKEKSISECRKLLGWSENSFYILFPGNPSRPEKNWDLALESATIAQKILEKEITLVPLHNILPDDVPLLINAANLVLMTSFSEGSPNVVKEALACNKCVVSVDVGDVACTLSNIEGCSLVEYDATVIGRKIAEIMNGPNSPVKGREKLMELSLDLNSVARKIFGIYKNVLSSNTIGGESLNYEH